MASDPPYCTLGNILRCSFILCGSCRQVVRADIQRFKDSVANKAAAAGCAVQDLPLEDRVGVAYSYCSVSWADCRIYLTICAGTPRHPSLRLSLNYIPCSDRSGPDGALVTGRSRSERSQQAKGYFYLNRQGEYVCHPCFVRLGSKLWTSPTRSTSPADAAHIKNVIRPLIREVRP